MGAKSSRPKPRARSSNCGYYKNQRDAFRRERDIYKGRSNYYSKLYNKALKKAINIQAELNLLREQAGNPQKHKEKAKELFHHLEKRYLDRLSLISTQQNLLDRQNVIISSKGKKIKNNRKEIVKQTDLIDTKNRQINYDMDENIDKNYFIKYLKLCFLILAIFIIGFLVKDYKNN